MISTDVSKIKKNVDLKDQKIKDLVDVNSPVQIAVVVDVISTQLHIKLQDQSKPMVNVVD